MSISADGWLDWCERLPGNPSKVNGGRNGLLGLAFHSAEGWEAYLRNYQTDPRYADRRASWHFSNLRNGVMLQHYPLYAQTWTSGAGYPNNNMPGTETEGVAGQPLNDLQNANVVRLIGEVERFTGRMAQRNHDLAVPAGILAIVEHRECVRWGAEATACPSGRYDWQYILSQLGGEPVTPQEEQELKERRANAELQIQLLYNYRTDWVDANAVKLLHNDGSETGIIIPLKPRPQGG